MAAQRGGVSARGSCAAGSSTRGKHSGAGLEERSAVGLHFVLPLLAFRTSASAGISRRKALSTLPEVSLRSNDCFAWRVQPIDATPSNLADYGPPHAGALPLALNS